MTPQEAQNFIDDGRKAGKSDMQIYHSLKSNPSAKNNFAKAYKGGMTDQQIAQSLGLNVQKAKDETKVEVEKPSYAADMGHRAREYQAGAKQAFLYATDKMQDFSNKFLGTKFDTKDYERYTAKVNDELDEYEKNRKASGKGFDWGGLTTDAMMMVAGRGAGRVAKISQAMSRTTLGRKAIGAMSANGYKAAAARGALGGAAMEGATFAKDSDERIGKATAGAVGGAGGGIVGEKMGKAISKRIQTTPRNVDIELRNALEPAGINLDDLSDDVVKGLRQDVKKALKSGKALDEEAIARKALLNDLGFQPTKAQLSRNATDWTNERELAKLKGTDGILTEKYIADDQRLTELLHDEIGKTGGQKTDDYVFNQDLLKTAQQKIQANKDKVNQAYDMAKKSANNDVSLNGVGFVNDAIKALDDEFLITSMPPRLKSILNAIHQHPDKLTMGKSQELIRMMNDIYKGTLSNGQPTSQTYAIKVVRDMLEQRQMEAVQGLLANGGDDAMKLWQTARHAHKENRQLIENIPLLKDAENGVEPDKLFQKHILGGTVGELGRTIQLLKQENPQMVADIKQSVLEHIANNSINSSHGLSPSAMKKALDKFGTAKLKTMFSDDEIKRLQNIQMAAEILKQAPIGSAVNHSNTASALANILGMMVDKVPLAKILKVVMGYTKEHSYMKGTVAMPDVHTVYDDDTVKMATKMGTLTGISLSNDE